MSSACDSLDLDAISVPEGWEPVGEIPLLRPNTPFLSSEERVMVRYFTRGTPGDMAGYVRFGAGTEGPPGHAHGGSMASVLDEVMGLVCWVNDAPVLAARIEVDFRLPMPIPGIVIAEGRMVGAEGRKVYTSGVLKGLDGTVYSQASGLFVRIDRETVANMG